MIRFCGILVVVFLYLLNEKKTLFRIPLKLHLNVRHGEYLVVNTESVIKSTKQKKKQSIPKNHSQMWESTQTQLKREIK